MFYYLYEIRNILNGKIYVGVHKTTDMNDSYMGSGKVIKRAIEKYGIDNFIKTVLEEFSTAEAMYVREKEIVTDDFLLREDVYNLRRGGAGGWDYINKNSLNINGSLLSVKVITDPGWHREISIKGGITSANKQLLTKTGLHSGEYYGFRSEEHQLKAILAATSYEANEKRKQTMDKNEHQRGEKNSQFGTMWITNETESIKIMKSQPIPIGWRKGRKIKFD